MKRKVLTAVLACMACGIDSSACGTTLVVDLGGGEDYADIQSAIDAAADGDTVLVKPGEYVITESINFNRLHNSDDPASPPVKNIVVKSEGGAEVTTIRMSETPRNADRASVLVFENGETAASALEGFTLTEGKGTGGFGGGVYCKGASPTILKCKLAGNKMTWGELGGGISCMEASPALMNCEITGNRAGCGGGVWAEESAPIIVNCLIAGNMADAPCCTMTDCAACGYGGALSLRCSQASGRPQTLATVV
jgi:hypothetical protein